MSDAIEAVNTATEIFESFQAPVEMVDCGIEDLNDFRNFQYSYDLLRLDPICAGVTVEMCGNLYDSGFGYFNFDLSGLRATMTMDVITALKVELALGAGFDAECDETSRKELPLLNNGERVLIARAPSKFDSFLDALDSFGRFGA